MSTLIVKCPPGDSATYFDCPQSYKYYEFHNKKHWLWTSYLSYNCFAIVLTSKQAIAFWHQPSKWEDEADRSLGADPFKSFLQPLLGSIKTWFRNNKEALAFKDNPEGPKNPRDLYIIKPSHGNGQEETLKWSTAALKDEFRIEPTVATYAPSNPDRNLGWATAEVCYDPNEEEYDYTGVKSIKISKVYSSSATVCRW